MIVRELEVFKISDSKEGGEGFIVDILVKVSIISKRYILEVY